MVKNTPIQTIGVERPKAERKFRCIGLTFMIEQANYLQTRTRAFQASNGVQPLARPTKISFHERAHRIAKVTGTHCEARG